MKFSPNHFRDGYFARRIIREFYDGNIAYPGGAHAYYGDLCSRWVKYGATPSTLRDLKQLRHEHEQGRSDRQLP